MARGRNKNKMTRRQPAVMQMEFLVPPGTSYIDLNLAASIVNRRAYAQKNTNWAVAQFEFLSFVPATGAVSIAKLPETWVLENAYKKSLALWDKMNDQVLDTEPSIKGKYHDFKIYLDDNMRQESIQHSADSTGRILTPTIGGDWTLGDFTGVSATNPNADWDWSILTIPNDPVGGTTSEYYIHAVGGNTAQSLGVIAGYELSRARPPAIDPSVPETQGWMTQLFDDGEQLDELRDNLEAQNDRAPYPVGASNANEAYYPGGTEELSGLQVHGFCNYTATTVGAKNTISGGMFGLGMLAIQNATEASLSLLVHMMPGKHRGYHVEEMC